MVKLKFFAKDAILGYVTDYLDDEVLIASCQFDLVLGYQDQKLDELTMKRDALRFLQGGGLTRSFRRSIMYARFP